MTAPFGHGSVTRGFRRWVIGVGLQFFDLAKMAFIVGRRGDGPLQAVHGGVGAVGDEAQRGRFEGVLPQSGRGLDELGEALIVAGDAVEGVGAGPFAGWIDTRGRFGFDGTVGDLFEDDPVDDRGVRVGGWRGGLLELRADGAENAFLDEDHVFQDLSDGPAVGGRFEAPLGVREAGSDGDDVLVRSMEVVESRVDVGCRFGRHFLHLHYNDD